MFVQFLSGTSLTLFNHNVYVEYANDPNLRWPPLAWEKSVPLGLVYTKGSAADEISSGEYLFFINIFLFLTCVYTRSRMWEPEEREREQERERLSQVLPVA